VVGPGTVHRAIMAAQRAHFDPPIETERHEPSHSRRVGAAIGRERSDAR
jgi:hypothetical protein